MKTALVIGLIASLLGATGARAENAAPRERLLLDYGWRFHLGDPAGTGSLFAYPEVKNLAKTAPGDAAEEAKLAAARPDPVATNLGGQVRYVRPRFNDRGWRKLDLPHDWAIELPFDSTADAGHGFRGLHAAENATVIGWYRRAFDLPASDRGRTLWVEFEGVYRNCLVWLNGHCLGRNVSGYSSFYYNLGRYANYGGRNELVVRVDASRTEGWFYEGAGIYRHVWLVKTGAVHVAHWGTRVTSELDGRDAEVSVATTLENDTGGTAGGTLVSTLLDAAGNPVGEARQAVTLAPGAQTVEQKIPVKSANLWSPESPYLYKLVSRVEQAGAPVDVLTTPFGTRTIRFDPAKGFFLNGRRVEIKGVCNHQDFAGVGVAVPDRIEEDRVAELKAMGCNAWRTSHNPPNPELLAACDRLGMLVMDENRRLDTSAEALGELRRMILRDRNHPSIVIWSIGNEEFGIQGSDYGEQVAKTAQNLVHRLDPTRPVTVAMNGDWGRGFSKVIDVQGCNYRTENIDPFHAAHPGQPVIGTETASTVTTRGIYADEPARGYVSAYGDQYPPWAAAPWDWWSYYAVRPYLAGGFAWTGFDYRGEPTPYAWPCVNSHFGILDTCGFPKDIYYYYQSWWTDQPVLHLAPHWSWPRTKGQEVLVRCFSNCDEVELFLNGKSLGKQAMKPNSYLDWKVAFAPGTLLAKGWRGGREVAEDKVETTGKPAALRLVPDRATLNADGADVSLVTVEVLDAKGRVVPIADNLVKFALSGSGHILGVGNGDPSCHESDQAGQRSVFNGRALVIVQSAKTAGPIQLTAESAGLTPVTLTLQAQACVPPPAVP